MTEPTAPLLRIACRDAVTADVLGFTARVRAVAADKRTVDVIASTDAQDRYGEIVEQVWQLDAYQANPVVLYAHDSRELPIGKAENIRVEDGQLVATLRFVGAEVNPRAEQVWQLVQEGVLRAVSVGFIPHTYRWEKRDDREVLVLTDNELVEISVVPVPANPEALARMRARALAARPPLAGWRVGPRRGGRRAHRRERGRRPARAPARLARRGRPG